MDGRIPSWLADLLKHSAQVDEHILRYQPARGVKVSTLYVRTSTIRALIKESFGLFASPTYSNTTEFPSAVLDLSLSKVIFLLEANSIS